MSKYRCKCKFTYENQFGTPLRIWSVVGPNGGLHLHISDHGKEHLSKYGYRYSGGLEMHYRYPPKYMQDQAPDSDRCWLLQCPCWHDGSSTWATEHWIPLWESLGDDHETMFERLSEVLREQQRSWAFGAQVAEIEKAIGGNNDG